MVDVQAGYVTAAIRDGVPDGPDAPTCGGCALWRTFDGHAGICAAGWGKLGKAGPDVLAECITYDATPACGQWVDYEEES